MSTLTTEKHYNTTMLRKLRDEVTSTLKDAGFQIPGNCKISGINELAVHLTIELILKSGNDLGKKQKDTEIKKALTAKYCENIVITNVSQSPIRSSVNDLLVTAEYQVNISATVTFVNRKLADLYGIKGVEGDEFQKVSLEGLPRRPGSVRRVLAHH